MVYVISDLHGCYDKFVQMLNLIDFNKEKDHLYILGDIVDRGDKPLELIRFCMENKNCVTLFMGNHERMVIDYFYDSYKDNWLYSNGGLTTYEQLKNLPDNEVREILDFFKNLKIYDTIEVEGRKFNLVHAFLHIDDDGNIYEHQSLKSLLWERNMGYYNTPNDTTIFGHTIISPPNNNFVHYNNTIRIDCGAFFYGRMGCLRLNDMKEFYI